MKIESYWMSNNEVLTALRMFNDDRWDDGKYHLKSVESIAEDEENLSGYVTSHHHSEIPPADIEGMEEFFWKFDNEWIVYVLTCDNEVCGLIAFSDWD